MESTQDENFLSISLALNELEKDMEVIGEASDGNEAIKLDKRLSAWIWCRLQQEKW